MIDELETRRDAVAALCRSFGVASLAVFGSAVDGTFDAQRSDIDFLVGFDPTSSLSRFEAFFGLKETLEGLFGRPVDLVSAESIENPYVAEAVAQTRHELYAA